MNVDVLTLQSFVAAAETRSFTAAAKRVGRSQSAVSQQIAKLEAELGRRLFERGKDISLTEDGDSFLPTARQILALLSDARNRFREPELAGELRFGLPEDFASVFLAGFLAEFARNHPRITLTIECDLTLNLFARFKKAEFDLVLLKLSHPEEFPNGTEVWSEPLEWVGRGDTSLPEGPVPLVMAPKPCVYRSEALRVLDRNRTKWRMALTSHSHAGKMAAVTAGLGITVLPRNMIPAGLQAYRSKALPKLDDIHISLLKRRKNHQPANSLAELILKKLGSR